MSLPSGYKRLEYIQSSGTQYIDTGFKPNQDTRVVTKFDMIQTDTTWRKLWGSGSGSYNLDFALWNDGTTKLQSYYGTKTNNAVPITSMSLNVDANKNIWEYSGETINFDKNNFTCAYSMYIFNVNKDDNPAYLPGMMKLYLFKIYDNDVLVRDFIPCKNPSGVVGLYDVVNNIFYGNAGTGSFVAGAEVKGSHKTLIDGTGYDIKAGKCLVGGTAYTLKKGRTLIGGTAYEISFGPDICTLIIKGTAEGSATGAVTPTEHKDNPLRYAYSDGTYQLTPGTSITLYAWNYYACKIYVNDELVARKNGSGELMYDMVLTKETTNVAITASEYISTIRVTTQ